MALDGVADEDPGFEPSRPDLVRSDRGRFAVVCGAQLLGMFESVDEALSASARAFDGGQLLEGAPVLISELAERVSLPLMARPVLRAGGRMPGLLA
jgi:hypothetical protein